MVMPIVIFMDLVKLLFDLRFCVFRDVLDDVAEFTVAALRIFPYVASGPWRSAGVLFDVFRLESRMRICIQKKMNFNSTKLTTFGTRDTFPLY